MQNEKWSFKPSDLVTIPNILSYLRLILVVPFVYYFIRGLYDDPRHYITAAVCIVISGLTDCFDGLLARKLNQVTSLGKILDPLADKITLIAVAVCMVIYIPALLPLMLVLFIKDFTMLICGLVLLVKKIPLPASRWYGKVATVVFYISVTVIIFLKAVYQYENPTLILVLFCITAAVMIFALLNYSKMFLDILKENKSKE
ncbi:MAG: CDP-alcohol phosphatidyltransferase family protein [Ruminococcus sp.]|nr:CDP-alcohol phosphatidyltransferase family protein [Ruminococcus sp.]